MAEAGLGGGIFERAIALVAVQDDSAITGDQKVLVAVIVIVRRYRPPWRRGPAPTPATAVTSVKVPSPPVVEEMVVRHRIRLLAQRVGVHAGPERACRIPHKDPDTPSLS